MKFKMKPQEKVLVRLFSQNKMDNKYEGPFIIEQIDATNYRVQVSNFRTKRWESIRNIKPYFERGGGCCETT